MFCQSNLGVLQVLSKVLAVGHWMKTALAIPMTLAAPPRYSIHLSISTLTVLLIRAFNRYMLCYQYPIRVAIKILLLLLLKVNTLLLLLWPGAERCATTT